MLFEFIVITLVHIKNLFSSFIVVNVGLPKPTIFRLEATNFKPKMTLFSVIVLIENAEN